MQKFRSANRGWKDDSVLLQQVSIGPLLSDFSGKGDFLSSGSQQGFILTVEGNRVEILVWLEAAWAGWM